MGVVSPHELPFTRLEIFLSGVPFIAVFYLHAYWLIPKYLSRKRIAVYVLSVLAAWVGVTMLSGLLFYWRSSIPLTDTHYYQFALRRILPGLFFLMASASLGAFRENFRLEKNRKEKETEHLRTELSFLRAQVNPHFMLNVLNSMALLARRKSDLLEPVLMELAGLMNYMLYDANNEQIALGDEIGYLKAYIDLQMLRFGDDVTVKFNTPRQTDNKYIEPMLLIPLVENAFKHGIGLMEEPVIMIDIRIEGDREGADREGDDPGVANREGNDRGGTNRLSMTVKNKYHRVVRQQESKPAGIGLKNLKKRLELIYPGQFELNVMDNYHVDARTIESWFIVTLIIPLL